MPVPGRRIKAIKTISRINKREREVLRSLISIWLNNSRYCCFQILSVDFETISVYFFIIFTLFNHLLINIFTLLGSRFFEDIYSIFLSIQHAKLSWIVFPSP